MNNVDDDREKKQIMKEKKRRLSVFENIDNKNAKIKTEETKQKKSNVNET